MGKTYVTAEDLLNLGWGKRTVTPGVIDDLNRTLTEFDITTPARIQHFLSQATKECDQGYGIIEYDSGKGYEGRKDLGNVNPGDGPKYKGSGAIHLTGRYNYQKFANYVGDQNVMQGRDYVAANYPWRSAGFFWKNNNLNAMVDRGASVTEITEVVNGGHNGLKERKEFYNVAVKNGIGTRVQQNNQVNIQQESPNVQNSIPQVQSPNNPPAVENQPASGLFTHTKDITVRVMPGDSVEKIAAMYGTAPDKVKDINGNVVTGYLNPDTAVLVGVNANYFGYDAAYTVQPGDDLNSISKRTGVLPETLRSLNSIGDQFDPGTKLKYNTEHNVLIINIDKNNGRITDLPAKWLESRYDYNPSQQERGQTKPGTSLSLMPEVRVPYTIQAGDTMNGMAKAFNVSQDKIVNSFGNAISGGAPGDTVYINVRPDDKGRIVYYAQKGDDLRKISDKVHINYNDLRSSNSRMYFSEVFDAGAPIYYKSGDIDRSMKFGGNPLEALDKWMNDSRGIANNHNQEVSKAPKSISEALPAKSVGESLSNNHDWRSGLSFGR